MGPGPGAFARERVPSHASLCTCRYMTHAMHLGCMVGGMYRHVHREAWLGALPRRANLHPKNGEGRPGGALNCQKKTFMARVERPKNNRHFYVQIQRICAEK